MIVQLFKESDRPGANRGAAKPANEVKSTPRVEGTRIRDDMLERCSAMRGGVRTMLRLAGEGAFDLWEGDSKSAHLQQFEVKLHQQRLAMKSMRIDRTDADYSFLVRKAQAALDAFAETVRREIIEGVDADTEELAFYAALNRVKDSAIRAAGCVGSIQVAAA